MAKKPGLTALKLTVPSVTMRRSVWMVTLLLQAPPVRKANRAAAEERAAGKARTCSSRRRTRREASARE